MIDNAETFKEDNKGHPMLGYEDWQLREADCVEIRASVSSTPVYRDKSGQEIECRADITRIHPKTGKIDRQYSFFQKPFLISTRYLNRAELRTKMGSEKENELNEVLTKKEKDE